MSENGFHFEKKIIVKSLPELALRKKWPIIIAIKTLGSKYRVVHVKITEN